jgi:hypothetical protein
MRVLAATLFINDASDAPTPGITIEIDGRPAIEETEVASADWLAAVDALGTAAGEDLRAVLSPLLVQLVADLQAAVQSGQVAQRARERALAEWQAAAPNMSTSAEPGP